MQPILSVILFSAFFWISSADDDKYYTNIYDNIDLDEILNNQRLYKNYIDCITNKGKCSPDGKELKKNIPDALSNNCSKCTQKQKDGTDKVLKFIIEEKPDDWKLLESIYDPQGAYKKKYKEQAEKRGYKLA
uniref:Chemosensory protein 1 n=1 Tax=Yemma signatus TaxID=300820 RepID=A0A3G2GRR1_9HEMI|nr:chemosensory protein 1 [Yemma signatus]